MKDPVTRLNAALEGRYAIERELGEGGMATVYLADDLKHERRVALKVLKPELAAVVGAERFLAEIKTTANLAHPHILPLFDSGEADGFLFYVMPHIQGESLRERIDREKQLGVDDSVAITQKVANALDYAHGHGVVHRDIKPGNILLSEQGEPLVADFGIALAVAQAGAGRITETGLSLGTPHYMSPEQATGDRDVDPRSDVYALGCVLFEMLAGQPPFSASTAQAVLVKILTADAPSITSERRTVPPHVGHALAKSLEKLPADRFTSAAEFATALGDERFTYKARARTATAIAPSEPIVPVATAQPWHRDGRVVAALLVAVTTSALAAWGWLSRPPIPEPGVPTRSGVTGLNLMVAGGGWKLAISPDGRWIVAAHVEEGFTPARYIRAANDPEWRRLANTEAGQNPTFSPDGQSVAFTTLGVSGISKVPITGGPALPIAAGFSPHWGVDNTIVYDTQSGLYRVASSGGEPELLFASDTVTVFRPHLLPNGRAVVFGTGTADVSRIFIFEIETGDVRELVPAGNQPRYVSTGHLIYGHSDGVLMGVPFDLETLETTGSPVTLLPELSVNVGGASQFAVSETGTLIYVASLGPFAGAARVLVEVNLEGVESPLPLSGGAMGVPRYSPEGRKIAYFDDGELRIYDVVTGASPQFATGTYPVWSTSGEYLYFSVNGPISDGYRQPADSREAATQLWDRPGGQYVTDVSAGDSIIVVRDNAPDRGRDVLLMRQGEDGAEFEDFLTAEWNEVNGEISPDGRWFAYQSDESGEYRIYVHSFPVITGRRPVSPGLGTDPVWSPDGQTLYYRSGSQFLAVGVATEPAFAVLSAPDVLFDRPEYTRYQNPGPVRTWDIHPDGSRFIMVKFGDESGGVVGFSGAYLVTNWFEELRQRMGN